MTSSLELTQDCTDIKAIVEKTQTVTPHILVIGRKSDMQGFLVVDKTIISEIEIDYTIPFILMAAYFVFNICYPKGFSNLFSFLEIVTFNYPPSKSSSTVKHLLSSLQNV